MKVYQKFKVKETIWKLKRKKKETVKIKSLNEIKFK